MSDHPITRYTVFRDQLVKPSEARAVAIAACAYLEDSLSFILDKMLPGLNHKRRQKVFSDGFLSDLSHKLDLALGLEIFSTEIYNQFVIVAQIRNRFAHRLDVKDFDHPEVAGLVDKLKLPKMLLIHLTGDDEFEIDERVRYNKYVVYASMIMAYLHNLRNHAFQGDTDFRIGMAGFEDKQHPLV